MSTFISRCKSHSLPFCPLLNSAVCWKNGFHNLKVCHCTFRSNPPHRTRDATRSKWDLLMWMGVSTLHASNIKGFVFEFALARPVWIGPCSLQVFDPGWWHSGSGWPRSGFVSGFRDGGGVLEFKAKGTGANFLKLLPVQRLSYEESALVISMCAFHKFDHSQAPS